MVVSFIIRSLLLHHHRTSIPVTVQKIKQQKFVRSSISLLSNILFEFIEHYLTQLFNTKNELNTGRTVIDIKKSAKRSKSVLCETDLFNRHNRKAQEFFLGNSANVFLCFIRAWTPNYRLDWGGQSLSET